MPTSPKNLFLEPSPKNPLSRRERDLGLADFGTGKSHGVFGTKHHPELPLLAPGATVECHGPELLDLIRELERLGLRAVEIGRAHV